MSKLLLLEDDLSLINGLSFAFQKAGHGLDIGGDDYITIINFPIQMG